MPDKVPSIHIEVDELTIGCGFHKRVGEQVDESGLSANGICQIAYHTFYPYLLSGLYGGSRLIHCTCRCAAGELTWRIAAKPYWLRPLINTLDRIFLFFGRTRDAIDRKVLLTVTDATQSCPLGYAAGTVYTVDILKNIIFKKALFCPASFDALYPYVTMMRAGAKVPWAKKPDVAFIQCPSEKHRVIYKVKKGT